MHTSIPTILNQKVGRLKVMDVLVICAVLLLVSGGIVYRMQSAAKSAQACTAPGVMYDVTVSNDVFSPSAIRLKQCDQINLSNVGAETYDLAFGTHENHIPYRGFERQFLKPREYFVFSALQSGDYVLHDHLRDRAKITLSIADKK